MSPLVSRVPHGPSPLRTVQVLGGASAGSSVHVRSLAAGLVARGVRVTVCAPAEADRAYGFTDTGAAHVHVPRSSDPVSMAALRTVCADADLVHAHGLHASLRAALALSGRRTPLVVTWHNHVQAHGPRARLVRMLERRVVKAATVVLGTTSDLVDRARSRGARDARLAAVAVPRPRGGHENPERPRAKIRAELGVVERPLLLSVGSLDRHRGHELLLDAAHAWRRADPAPLVLIAGEGPLRPVLQRRIEAEDLPVRLLGRRDDVGELLAAADLALLPGSREARPVLAQEALHAQVPLVAVRDGGIPELVGDAAELVPQHDAEAFAAAVVRLLGDPVRRKELRERGLRQAAGWPTEDETVAQVLAVYDELTSAGPLF
ncbi:MULTISPECIES: glycosyltransferase family 4 protein [Streptomyces]|uniref:Glycosyltransferase family 4 protein n=1 Tax=Streptomyces thermoviolaceus subsp. thermoviolaceus TaxID=66860 RepID=A0ABX0YM13_STRTL|nr:MULTISPECIES: glycosyltransferase family 4 protein [Streptomyces]MCM3266979.1 glycosyltransferase family 4 protein [Streptomyces thermoviolaceus]NJP13027.1 glycosyltransferase family 4 protein [Streptomyces thermoviolaceus subsp. thermoviolaceus]RSS02335.1 glycosyltransferase [Streptomyces sp. WAC00469]WTD49815.1 glycosyltransferase family 4 protein [Streptomyces thermoviolaceus]GGV67243.1 glycosyl transferase [Streptomyces thermoviolaceus subsp. apingens]